MKGMVFTNFLEMVEEQFSIDVVDVIIEESKIPSGGAYTTVGTYPHSEMVALLQALEKEVSIPIPDLLKFYGKYLFGKLAKGYPSLISDCNNSRDLLLKLDGVIHVEVKKLYPDAELPRFKSAELSDGRLQMHYLSDRHMEDLAEGLLNGCFEHFNESVTMERIPQEDGTVIFNIKYESTPRI